jgi:hypothetical protein
MQGLAVKGEACLKPNLEFSGDIEDKIIQACDECLAAHRQCTELNPEMGGALAGRDSSASGDYALYSKRRSEALAKLMKLRASSARGLAAKRDVLTTLLDWFDLDEPFIGKFASRLVDEYHWVFIGGSSGALWPHDHPPTKAFWSTLVKLCPGKATRLT